MVLAQDGWYGGFLVYQVVFHGKENESGCIFSSEALHQPVFDGFHRTRTDLHFSGDLRCGEFHAEQADHFFFLIVQHHLVIQRGDGFGSSGLDQPRG